MPRFHSRPVLAGLLLAALLVGCGQKGPLYLPKSQSPSSSSEQPPTAKP
ncbi:MAG: lipoprotein [Candidatus Competibacter sp.]|nr:lipoprotein [Candidatus Competibacter sp.]MDG4584200.1 lipoprotein [Candidatus Competibacter sp.]